VGDLNPESLIRERLNEPTGTVGEATMQWLGHRLPFAPGYCLHILRLRLVRSVRQSLSAIYFSKVNHIMPIVDQELFQAQGEGSASVSWSTIGIM
jgi:hypothetical protein